MFKELDIERQTLILEDGQYYINTDSETFYNNVGNGANYLKSMNLIAKLS